MIYSSGIIVVCKDPDWKCLMLRNGSIWDFPKGKLETNETFFAAALRETQEEANLTDFWFPWGEMYFETKPYQKGKKRKKVRYYLAKLLSGSPEILPNKKTGKKEHQEAKWFFFTEPPPLQERLLEAFLWAKGQVYDENRDNQSARG